MESIALDGQKMLNRREAHDHLAEQLALPEYYGRNLDALYDLLTEREGPTCLEVHHQETILSWLGEYGTALLQTLEDAARVNPGLVIRYPED